MSKSTNSKISKWFMAMGAVLFSYSTFMVGFAASQSHWADTGANLLLALLWGGLFVIMYKEHIFSIEMAGFDREMELLTKIAKAAAENYAEASKNLDEILAAKPVVSAEVPMQKQMEEQLTTSLIEIIIAITGDPNRPPNMDEIELATRRFHEQTDQHVRMHVEGNCLSVDISPEPLAPAKPPKPARKPRTTAKRNAKRRAVRAKTLNSLAAPRKLKIN